MARSTKTTLFDRKLKDLEKQRDLIQNDIRSLSKSLRKVEDGGELPPLRSRVAETRAAPAPEVAEAPAAIGKVEAAEAVDGEPDRLAPPGPPEPEVRAPAQENAALRPLVLDARRNTPFQNQKFASYLASGSFGKNRPLADERRIQRNKAIFMVIVVVLVLVVVLRFIL